MKTHRTSAAWKALRAACARECVQYSMTASMATWRNTTHHFHHREQQQQRQQQHRQQRHWRRQRYIPVSTGGESSRARAAATHPWLPPPVVSDKTTTATVYELGGTHSWYFMRRSDEKKHTRAPLHRPSLTRRLICSTASPYLSLRRCPESPPLLLSETPRHSLPSSSVPAPFPSCTPSSATPCSSPALRRLVVAAPVDGLLPAVGCIAGTSLLCPSKQITKRGGNKQVVGRDIEENEKTDISRIQFQCIGLNRL